MQRSALVAAAILSLAGCGSWKRAGTNEKPKPSEQLTQLFNLQTFYQRLGRLAAGDPLPFIGTVAFVAGPADTAVALVGLSLENRWLSFQREQSGFVAKYRVEISLQQASLPPIEGAQDEIVRVATFQETQRNDESVLFQKIFRVKPGRYHVIATLRDQSSGTQSKAEADFDAPDFSAGTTTRPILAYQAGGRATLADPINIVLNPRGTVGYGPDTLLAYIEGYRFSGPTKVPFQVRTETDSVVYSDSLLFRGNQAIESQVIRLRPDSMALGELKLVVGSGTTERSTSALVSLSQAWVVTNFDEMIDLLRYFGHDVELADLKKAAPADRTAIWRKFWKATDPNPSTPENEALDRYFGRIALANTRFRDEGVPGWRTDRGEVYVILGEPDEILDASPMSQGRVIRWTYVQDRLALFFTDESGFNRFRLLPASRADFERTVARKRRQVS